MATTYRTVEPRGFGNQQWGNITITEDKEFNTSGWGDKTTTYTENNDD